MPADDAVLPFEPIDLPAGWPALVGDDLLALEFTLPGGACLMLETWHSDAAKGWCANLSVVRSSGSLCHFAAVGGATTHGRALRAVVLAAMESGFVRSA